MEGALFRVPAIAFSLASRARRWDFQPAAEFARALVQSVEARPMPPGALLNVNIPDGPVRGFAITRLGKRSYGQVVVERVDPRGRPYFWIGGDEQAHEDLAGSDCCATYDEGMVSITPLHLDLTHPAHLNELRGLRIDGYEGR
jgi:5'-nucleotidase